MPPEALSLALAASIYPPAVAAVIALGHGDQVRSRVVLFVVGAFVTMYVVGVLLLLLFVGVDLTPRHHRTPSGAVYVALGVVAILLAVRLSRPRGGAKPKKPGSSRTDRYLHSRRLVVVLAFILYVVPSPIYLGAVKSVADTHASTATQLVYLTIVVLVTLWLVELPMGMLLVAPGPAVTTLERTNQWFVRHGRMLVVTALAVSGLYLVAHGIDQLVS